MSKVLLDGKFVDADLVTPDKARFIGVWRPPRNPYAQATGYIRCSCGRTLKCVEESIEHYRDGCCDVPQYVSLSQDRPVEPVAGQKGEAGE